MNRLRHYKRDTREILNLAKYSHLKSELLKWNWKNIQILLDTAKKRLTLWKWFSWLRRWWQRQGLNRRKRRKRKLRTRRLASTATTARHDEYEYEEDTTALSTITPRNTATAKQSFQGDADFADAELLPAALPPPLLAPPLPHHQISATASWARW